MPTRCPATAISSARTCSFPPRSFPCRSGLHAAGPVMLGVGRLKPGVSVARAASDLEVIRQRLVAAGLQPLRRRAIVVCRAVWTHARGRARAGSDRRDVADRALAAARVGRRRAADRVRQRQPAAAGARGRSASGKSRCARRSAPAAARSPASWPSKRRCWPPPPSISGFLLGRWALAGSELAAAAGVGADPDPCSARRRASCSSLAVVALLTATMCGLAAGAAVGAARTSIASCRPVRAGHRVSATGRATS